MKRSQSPGRSLNFPSTPSWRPSGRTGSSRPLGGLPSIDEPMRRIWIGRIQPCLLMAFAALIASCGGIPSVEETRLIVVDFPHGGRRISVEPDGSGVYAYGALPALGSFEAGTFDFEEVHRKLRAVAERNRREAAEEFGTVQFLTDRGSEGALYFAYDRELLAGLLATAFENRVEPPGAGASDALQTLNELWLAEEEAP